MVYTTPLAPGLAVQLAVPLATVDQEVTSVGTTLALLSVIGVGLAALAGWRWRAPGWRQSAGWRRSPRT